MLQGNEGEVTLLNEESRHEDVWESGGITTPILNLGIRWK